MHTLLVASEVRKTFIMHMRGGIELPVVANVSFSLKAGSCAVLGGPSGVGKSSILKMLYGNYGTDSGQILAILVGRHVDVATRIPANGARNPARHDRLCQPVPARGAAGFRT